MSKRDMPWEEAIQTILRDADSSLHYSEIAEQIVSRGLRKAVGATPAATVASHLSVSLREPLSPYLKVGRGEYTLKELAERGTRPEQTDEEESDTTEAGALQSFGMFWRRELVEWKPTKPKILGKQQAGASAVDFSKQIGVYLLHDGARVIYVGRASGDLATRLRAHTSDRLGGRWDRFSWFGLRGVDETGNLITQEAPWTPSVVIDTMEALLIESLEPPLNRKRGDKFSGVEYVQVPDPSIERARKQAMLNEIASNL